MDRQYRFDVTHSVHVYFNEGTRQPGQLNVFLIVYDKDQKRLAQRNNTHTIF